MSLRNTRLDKLTNLLERDHGGCDQNTCSISVALHNGYTLHALDMFHSSGAADKEFDRLFAKHAKYIQAESRKEADLMCDEIEHVDCPTCNAVLWDPKACNYYCDSCANDIPKPETA